MAEILGTVRPGSTIEVMFNTYDSNDPSASVAIAAFVAGDIEVYKDGSVTQRASDSGYTLLDTDGIDFDGHVGVGGFSIDLADNTTAGFWASGSRYKVVVGPVTVDAAVINFVAATFRIGYPDAIFNTTILSLTSATQFILTVGPAEADVFIGCPVLLHDVASAVQFAFGVVSDYIVTTKEVFLAATPVGFTPVATDNIAFFMPSNVGAWNGVLLSTTDPLPTAAADAAGGLIISDAGGLDADAQAASVTAIEVDTGTTLDGRIPAALVSGRMDASVDATGFEQGAIDNIWDEPLTGASHNDPTSAGRRLRQVEESFIFASGVIATVTNGHTFTLDTGALANADYYIGARLQIEEGTGAGQSRLIIAYSVGRVAILDSDFDTNPDTSSLYSVVAADVHVSLSDADLAEGFVAVYTNTTTITLDSTIAVATTDFYVGEIIVFTHGTGAGQAREITAYTSGRVVTMSPALVTALDTTTVWHIMAAVSIPEIVDEVWDEAQSAHVAAGSMGAIATETAAIQAVTDLLPDAGALNDLAAILADTNELQADWTDGGRLDLLLDLVATTADLLDKLGAVNEAAAAGDPSATESVMQYVKQIINILIGATGIVTMPAAAAPANNVSLAEMIRAIYDDTNSLDGTKIPDTISLAAINAEVDTAFTTQMAAGKATVGQLPTREQALLEVRALLAYFAISGTTLTTLNPDTTEAGTYTLDDGTTPTSLTPAT